LENKGDLAFEPCAHPSYETGRWLTLATGDLDGDGDLDVVLGGRQKDVWAHASEIEYAGKRAALILENRRK
jgi:hypothetical protein